MPWYRKLHWQIIAGLVLGLLVGVLAVNFGFGELVTDWLAPLGTIFVNLLKLIAIPLILASLVVGVTSLSDTSKLSRIGGKTIGIYLGTTVIALLIGLTVVNLVQPGRFVSPEMRAELENSYVDAAADKQQGALAAEERGPLQPLIDIVPDNFSSALSDNRAMLQIVFAAIAIGFGLMLIPGEKAEPLIRIFDAANTLIIKLVDLIMLYAPIGVFGLMAGTIVSIVGDDPGELGRLLLALGGYCLTVLAGLLLHTFVVYPILLRFFGGMPDDDVPEPDHACAIDRVLVVVERCDATRHDGGRRGPVGCQQRGVVVRAAHRRDDQHGRHGAVPGRRGRLHRPGDRNGSDAGSAGSDRADGRIGVDRNGSRTIRRHRDARHHSGKRQYPRSRHRTDSGAGSHPRHVPHGHQRDGRPGRVLHRCVERGATERAC